MVRMTGKLGEEPIDPVEQQVTKRMNDSHIGRGVTVIAGEHAGRRGMVTGWVNIEKFTIFTVVLYGEPRELEYDQNDLDFDTISLIEMRCATYLDAMLNTMKMLNRI